MRGTDPIETLRSLGREMEEKPEAIFALAEELLWVRGRQGRLMPLKANAVQRAFEQRRGRQNIVLKARQMGLTTWIAARFFLRTITRPGTLTLMVAQTREAGEGLFRIVQRMWECMPEDMREGELQLRRLNSGQMVFAEIDSEIRVASASDENAGRGLSVQNLHCSEVSRWPGDAAATLAGLRAALAPDGECVLESTPHGAYGAFYEEWMRGVEGPGSRGLGSENGEGAVRHFFPWWMEPSYVERRVAAEEMREDELALVARFGLSEKQIGFRRGLERTYGVLRAQEFAEDAESCFRATGACCFEIEAIEQRMFEAPEAMERRRNGAMLVWLPAQSAREYVVAVDTAGGGEDGDFAAVQVVELATGMQCAELKERLRPAELARVAAELAREFCGATIAVERNNHGAAVLAYLETVERYEKVWRDQRGRGEAGWLTTAASKAGMIARMGKILSETPEMLMSRRLLGECRTFVSGERGRMGAAGGAHDDLVMSMAVAQAVRGEMMGRRRG